MPYLKWKGKEYIRLKRIGGKFEIWAVDGVLIASTYDLINEPGLARSVCSILFS